MIRPATAADIPGILAIWNPIIRDSLITFTDAERSPGDIAALIEAREGAGAPLLVTTGEGGVGGFGFFVQFRAGPGYRHSFEHTIHLAPAARGRGVGRRLLQSLESAAAEAGGHMMLAGVSAENPGGRAFHAAMGYAEIARLPEVGRKADRWLDLILMQKRIDRA